jgi:hypothetical protein
MHAYDMQHIRAEHYLQDCCVPDQSSQVMLLQVFAINVYTLPCLQAPHLLPLPSWPLMSACCTALHPSPLSEVVVSHHLRMCIACMCSLSQVGIDCAPW